MKNLANVLALLLLVAALGLMVGCGCGSTTNQTTEEDMVETPTDPTVPPMGDASAVAVAGAVCLAAAAAFVFMKKRG